MQKVNFKNAFIVFRKTILGQRAFTDSTKVKDLQIEAVNSSIKAMGTRYHGTLLKKILDSSSEVQHIVSYKNFEYQLLHSLDQEDSIVSISRKLLSELLSNMIDNKLGLSL